MQDNIKIDITTQTNFSLQSVVETAAKQTIKTLGYDSINTALCVFVCDNNTIQEKNKAFRNIDKQTDTLSFPNYTKEFLMNAVSTNNPTKIYFLGDIIISNEKAKQQSIEYNHSIEREIAFLTVHSVLHLLGYDHIDGNEAQRMFALQDEILTQINFSRDF